MFYESVKYFQFHKKILVSLVVLLLYSNLFSLKYLYFFSLTFLILDPICYVVPIFKCKSNAVNCSSSKNVKNVSRDLRFLDNEDYGILLSCNIVPDPLPPNEIVVLTKDHIYLEPEDPNSEQIFDIPPGNAVVLTISGENISFRYETGERDENNNLITKFFRYEGEKSELDNGINFQPLEVIKDRVFSKNGVHFINQHLIVKNVDFQSNFHSFFIVYIIFKIIIQFLFFRRILIQNNDPRMLSLYEL